MTIRALAPSDALRHGEMENLLANPDCEGPRGLKKKRISCRAFSDGSRMPKKRVSRHPLPHPMRTDGGGVASLQRVEPEGALLYPAQIYTLKRQTCSH